jgi:hypothetical protein
MTFKVISTISEVGVEIISLSTHSFPTYFNLYFELKLKHISIFQEEMTLFKAAH